jgi:CRISPR-associated endonuclease/helicase Cas3
MSGKVCSHPGKPLEKHLLNTLNLAREIAQRFSLELSPEQEKAILFHDIGKAHLQFQIRLCKNCNLNQVCATGMKRKMRGAKRLCHAEPSAALVLALTKEVAVSEAVRRHHTGIENLEEVKKFWIDELDYSNSEGTGVYDKISQLAWWDGAKELALTTGLSERNWTSIFPGENKWQDFVFDLMDDFDFEGPTKYEKWINQRIFYSLLVASDRWEAAIGEKLRYRELVIESERIRKFLANKENDNLSQWRDSIRCNTIKNAEKIITCPGIYTLTLPTGTGKTIIGLQLAMNAAKRFNASGIVYVLPFVSLVEQNAEIAAQFFDTVQEDHHLAYFGERDNNDENDMDAVQKFISVFRYWREPVIVTTLSKFWEVLFSPRGNDSMSFHRLNRAVILLDEPQSIPACYWEGFGNVIKFISEKLGSTFILMTATQPEIASGRELAIGPVNFPKIRHEIQWLKEKKTIGDAVSFLNEKGIKEKDTLVVLNTKEAALRMFFELRKLGVNPFFLSRWVTPKDRARVIQLIKAKEKNKEARWLVSTQVIEAGMDMDFSMVFRDLGPLDSIVQVAGRCNRHGRRNERGKVYVAELFDERNPTNKSFSSMYDKILITQTRNLLNDCSFFTDKQYSTIISRYYKAVKEAVGQSNLWENIKNGNWGEYSDLFEEKPLPEGMLVIDYDGTIVYQLEKVLNMNSSLENRDERRRVFGILNQNSISVPLKYLEEWQCRDGGMILDDRQASIVEITKGLWVLSPKGIGTIYRPDICFIPPKFADEYTNILKDMG